jgi:hypothetical protein
LAYALSEQGYEEPSFHEEDDINNPDENIAKHTTRLGQLAKYKTEYYMALIERLKEGIEVNGQIIKLTPEEEAKMRVLIQSPKERLEINEELMPYVVIWADTHLADLWNTGKSAMKVKRSWEYRIRQIMPQWSEEQIAQVVEDKTDRIMIKHSGSFGAYYEPGFKALSEEDRTFKAALDKLSPEKLQKIRDLFPEEYDDIVMATLREYLYYFIPLLRKAYLRGDIDRSDLIAESKRICDLIKVDIEKKHQKDSGNDKIKQVKQALRHLMYLVIVDGSAATWNRGGEQVHFFKWNSLTASLPYVHGPTLDLIDSDHHARTEDIWSAP